MNDMRTGKKGLLYFCFCRLEKINGDVYDFSTNKKLLKQPVDVWLPCHPIIHPNLQMIKLKALFKGEEEWVYHNWTLFVSDTDLSVFLW